MILNSEDIKQLCLNHNPPMITPFQFATRERDGLRAISFGLSHCGYDITLNREYKVIKPYHPLFPNYFTIDPKFIRNNDYIDVHDKDAEFIFIEPLQSILCRSNERFNMPNDVMGICVGKSTYARCGLFVNTTPIEPGWRGHLTIELTNLNRDHAIKIYIDEGIAQIIFHRWYGEKEGETYHGSYQDSEGVTVAIVQ